LGGGKIATKTVDLSQLQEVRDYLESILEPDTDIIFMKGNKPFAKLVAYHELPQPKPERVPDLYPTLWVSEDFDDLLPGEYWLTEQS